MRAPPDLSGLERGGNAVGETNPICEVLFVGPQWRVVVRPSYRVRHRDSDYGAQAAGLLSALCHLRAS